MLGQEQLNQQVEIQPSSTRGKISRREMDVLLQVKDGLRNPEIAERLGLSTKTIENHVRSILQKLGAKNRTEAVVIALRNSIIEI
jgi:DNA-binding NarL/FixJ family response regulator